MADLILGFDFTNTTEAGWTVFPADKYVVVTDDWYTYIKDETGNTVYIIDLKIKKGEFKGEKLRHFQTVTGENLSRRIMLTMLSQMGIIKEGDRGPNNELKVEFVKGDLDKEYTKNERYRVKGVKVNGTLRKLAGYTCVATVSITEDQKQNRVERIDRDTSGEPGAWADTPALSVVPPIQADQKDQKELPF